MENCEAKVAKQFCKFPVLETLLLGTVEAFREKKIPVVRDSISSLGALIRDKLLSEGQTQLTQKERVDLGSFAISPNWVSNFVKRNLGQSITLYGQGGSCPEEKDMEEQLAQLKSQLSSTKPEHIYNCDETALFYACLPRKT